MSTSSGPSLSWHLTNRILKEGQSPHLHLGVKGLLDELSERFRRPEYEFKFCPDGILSLQNGFRITWGRVFNPGEIDQTLLMGGGEVNASHGVMPVLFLGLLAKALREVDLGRKLVLADEKGESVELKNWSQIKSELIRLGYFCGSDFAKVRHMAEQLGLLISFTNVGPDENEQFYF